MQPGSNNEPDGAWSDLFKGFTDDHIILTFIGWCDWWNQRLKLKCSDSALKSSNLKA
jgi:hypothetical protein